MESERAGGSCCRLTLQSKDPSPLVRATVLLYLPGYGAEISWMQKTPALPCLKTARRIFCSYRPPCCKYQFDVRRALYKLHLVNGFPRLSVAMMVSS